MTNEEETISVALISDTILLKRIRQGDVESFETLFHRHYDRVYGLLFRLIGNRSEAEDVTQEIFLKLYRRPLRGREEHNLRGWLYRVATNMGYNHIRSNKRRWSRDRILLPDSSDHTPDPSEHAAALEERELVRAALTRLPPRQSQLLLLRQMGLSYNELAEAGNVSPGSVGTLLARAAAAFREAYQAELALEQQ